MVAGAQTLTTLDLVTPKQGHVIGNGDTLGLKDTVWLQAQDSGALGQILESNADKDDFMKLVVGDKRASLAGWHEAVIGMRKGGKRIAIFPPSLAYGAAGVPPTIPPKATLVCEIEVIRLKRAAAPASAAPTAPSTPVHAGTAPAAAAPSTPLSQGTSAAAAGSSLSEADLAAAQKEQLLARLAMAGAKDILGANALGAGAAPVAAAVPQIQQQPQVQGYGNALALYNPAQAQVQQPIYQPQVQPQPIYAAPAPQPVAPPPQPQPQVNRLLDRLVIMLVFGV